MQCITGMKIEGIYQTSLNLSLNESNNGPIALSIVTAETGLADIRSHVTAKK